MKNILSLFLTFSLLITSLYSCKKQNPSPSAESIIISNFEIGSGHGHHSNDAKAIPGRDIHTAGEILCPNKIANILIIISSSIKDAWHEEFKYSNYNGQLNASFHEHIDIPKTAKPGEYDFIFKVTDTKGLSSEYRRKLTIIKKKNSKEKSSTI